jgi:hypothetical protein
MLLAAVTSFVLVDARTRLRLRVKKTPPTTLPLQRKQELDTNLQTFLTSTHLTTDEEAVFVVDSLQRFLDSKHSAKSVPEVAAISTAPVPKPTMSEARKTLPAGVPLPEEMKDPEFTGCGWAGKCDENLKKLTTQQKYLYLGSEWTFPEGVTRASGTLIPKVVHYVISDRRTRHFDWTCYLSVRAAMDHINPWKIVFHVYENVEPFGGWWEETKKLNTVSIIPFTKEDVPQILNGVPVTIPAHIADFRRFQVLAKEGGIYMDTDHIILKPIDDLLHYKAVWGRQALNEEGHKVAIGCMMSVPDSELFSDLYNEMKKAYNGGWATHSIDMVDTYFKTHHPEGVLILPYGALYPFSWQRGDLCCDYYYHKDMQKTSLTEGSGFDWSNAYSFHLFHSQSGSFIQSIEKAELTAETNLAVAVRKSIKDEHALFELLSKYPYDSEEVKSQTDAAKTKLGIPLDK